MPSPCLMFNERTISRIFVRSANETQSKLSQPKRATFKDLEDLSGVRRKSRANLADWHSCPIHFHIGLKSASRTLDREPFAPAPRPPL